MKTQPIIAQCMQDMLSFLLITACYAREFYDALPGELEERTRWSLAVEMIFNLLASGLISSTDDPDMHRPENKGCLENENRRYARLLSEVDPSSTNLEDYVVWQMWDLRLTDAGKKFLKKHGISTEDSPLNEGLVEEIEDLFNSHRLDWSPVQCVG